MNSWKCDYRYCMPAPRLNLVFKHYKSWFFFSFFLFSELRLEVIVRFDDIGGIVDLPCLNYILQTTISELENGYYI